MKNWKQTHIQLLLKHLPHPRTIHLFDLDAGRILHMQQALAPEIQRYPVSLLVNVSLDDVLPDVVFEASAVIVDDWNLVKNDSRRLIGRMYREGKIIGPGESGETIRGQRRKINAEVGEVVNGIKAGRKSPQDIILVNPFGLAIEDVALAGQIYQSARNIGIGMYLRR